MITLSVESESNNYTWFFKVVNYVHHCNYGNLSPYLFLQLSEDHVFAFNVVFFYRYTEGNV